MLLEVVEEAIVVLAGKDVVCLWCFLDFVVVSEEDRDVELDT